MGFLGAAGDGISIPLMTYITAKLMNNFGAENASIVNYFTEVVNQPNFAIPIRISPIPNEPLSDRRQNKGESKASVSVISPSHLHPSPRRRSVIFILKSFSRFFVIQIRHRSTTVFSSEICSQN
ncbi:Hypothetical predicted protein [Olea europaea subsp. europaea]|uniref:Uncharacterized protein n=1 Tax=Olea europaea subsp. europaea TaxID=158383 RepID=A0A8S0SLX1_OLEEU|nr:Hypothetical predicted protein [Olea europaea subsp. europaea]